jgi:hypothetical protein
MKPMDGMKEARKINTIAAAESVETGTKLGPGLRGDERMGRSPS